MNRHEDIEPATTIKELIPSAPKVGELVRVRSRRWLVDEVSPVA